MKMKLAKVFILNLILMVSLPQAFGNICNRTSQVISAITRQVKKPCGAVSSEDLRRITSLSLYKSSLANFETVESLQDHDLRGLTSLQELRISDTNIRQFPATLLYGLSSLRTLSLTGNRNVKTIPVNFFKDQQNLFQLDLSFNRFRSLPVGVFNGLTSLFALSLLDGDLGPSLPYNLFDPLINLVQLNLRGNRLNSLQMRYFYRRLNVKQY